MSVERVMRHLDLYHPPMAVLFVDENKIRNLGAGLGFHTNSERKGVVLRK